MRFLPLLYSSLAAVLSLSVGNAHAATIAKRAPAQVFRKCTVSNTVALTFDDGPFYYLNDLVTMLNQQNVTATFFVNGMNWGCIYDPPLSDALKFAYDSGHQVASHTWAHRRMTELSWDEIHDEMWRVELALSRITGAYPAFMRPPYGEFNDLVLEASAIRGQSIVIWDFDSEDGRSASVERQKQLYDEAAAARPDSILSLQHEVHATSVYETLPYAIQTLRAAGYRFVSVAECLGGLPPYQWVGAPGVRDSSWTC
ncbi:hypothetical protein CC1G_09057 [Coprinopsis cinerea okayama7|uniref:NodB homology domain-containing protein n=1 Tax=Coprinopsis cinerea (strain Okayama-7 / 130 / ATCC MYA-4618 / FGSC 9003) TaxID=240176 RepID=A8P2Z0_COPC7|nr:hypothetical protein CC1G_09057 [Coprinopsis cinerea okayama7\|eukprot:XP_001838429.2 hypothetical protein CC1G_09057 [Coprinopsis cinerea okayama7\